MHLSNCQCRAELVLSVPARVPRRRLRSRPSTARSACAPAPSAVSRPQSGGRQICAASFASMRSRRAAAPRPSVVVRGERDRTGNAPCGACRGYAERRVDHSSALQHRVAIGVIAFTDRIVARIYWQNLAVSDKILEAPRCRYKGDAAAHMGPDIYIAISERPKTYCSILRRTPGVDILFRTTDNARTYQELRSNLSRELPMTAQVLIAEIRLLVTPNLAAG
jgi:hypothetical protein